ncbi:hypothetical protein VK70_20120 [Paenibacillus durus ATCC 35681]|uniref:Uncharacterized protein n=1 Tax=Paenibacillus durus ATCC 35681 TaxID=1333534 RepID=A0A0F7FCR7_PAEDU|nr:hypothetical protein VK70_20120 [Paenibacillus durus ATCC 35681]
MTFKLITVGMSFFLYIRGNKVWHAIDAINKVKDLQRYILFLQMLIQEGPFLRRYMFSLLDLMLWQK